MILMGCSVYVEHIYVTEVILILFKKVTFSFSKSSLQGAGQVYSTTLYRRQRRLDSHHVEKMQTAIHPLRSSLCPGRAVLGRKQ